MKRLIFLMSGCIFLFYSCSDDTNEFEKTDYQIDKRQYTMQGFTPVNGCEASQLTYFIPNCFDGTGYEDAIPAGMELYNQLGSALNFTEVPTAAEADLVFSCANGGICGEANASFPVPNHPEDMPPNTQTFFGSGGSIGQEIELNINWNNCQCNEEELDLCFFTHTVAHEVAHTLGIYHNSILQEIANSNNPAFQALTPNHVAGTTMDNYDPNSIINSGGDEDIMGNWCDWACEFNENDIITILSLYPAVVIDGPTEICVGESVEFCLSDDLVGNWAKKSNPFWPNDTSPLKTNCSTYTFNVPGTFTIQTEVNGCIVSKEITVFENEPCPFPTTPPAIFTNVCFLDEPACWDFGGLDCIESLTAFSSAPKLTVSVNGTEVCLEAIHFKEFDATVTITVESKCGPPVTVTYDLTVNQEGMCAQDGGGGFGGNF